MSRPDLDALENLADEVLERQKGTDFQRYMMAEPATIKALIAELKEARGLLTEILESDKDWLVLAPDQSVRVSAFLARNGKGEAPNTARNAPRGLSDEC